ncbi:MAG: hypothetical protein RRZ66_12100 [Bacteroidales bacterium]
MKNKLLYSCFILPFLCVFSIVTVYAQPDSVKVSEYFATIRKDENRLRQFFAEMPKGGDLHNHLTGAVYAESYFKFAAKDGLWVDMATGKLYQPKDSTKGKEMLRLSLDMPNLHNTRMALIDKWSIRNFNPGKFPLGADEYFFGAFGLFNVVAGKHTVELMQELRKRAARENVQYLEIMLSSPGINAAKIDALCGNGFYARYNNRLQKVIFEDTERAKGREGTDKVLDDIFKEWEKIPAMSEWVNKYIAYIDSIDTHSTLSSGYDRAPVCYYQGYASRNAAPLVVYAQLYVAFKSCLREESKLVGVNIVSAENSETAMTDYTAHMKMFRYLDKATGNRVKASLHAGELTLGLVEPEEMCSHIREAIFVAGADRIGHGVDVAFEEGSISLLDAMRKRQIPVEINLTSNEFILGVKNDAHPFMLYRQAGVPTILSTDDSGILRTNLTQQYVLAALRYGLGYYEIKQLVRNSIRLGFMPEDEKQALLKLVEKESAAFEKIWRKNIETINKWED